MADSLVRWIAGRFAGLPPGARTWLIVGLAFVVVYAALAFAVRRLAPALVEYVFRPAVVLVTHAAAVLLFGIQALLALPFRGVRARPPGLLYGVGDATLAAAVGVRAGTRELLRPVRRLRLVRGRYFVLVILLTALWWNHSGCTRDQRSDRCRHPVPAGAGVLQDGAAHLWYRATSALAP